MKRFHPSRRRLKAWLDSDEPGGIGDHIETCDVCATRIEELARPGPDMRALLFEITEPPEDLVPRLNRRIGVALRDRADLQLLAEMLGVSWQTTRLMLPETPDFDD